MRRPVRLRLPRDLAASALGALIFSLALGIASVALPLLALDSGYSTVAVGLLTAVSAVAQMVTRMGLGAVMRRYPDWILIFSSAAMLAISCAIVAYSPALVPFLLAETLQGTARACFWTGSQTHVVRGDGPSVGRLATVNFISSGGQFAGPVLAGFLIERSAGLALLVAAVIAAIGLLPPLLLDRLPPFAKVTGTRDALWRRPGVDTACLAGITAGGWRGLLSSYIPVVLAEAGQQASRIGVLVAVANLANTVGTLLVGRVRERQVRGCFALGTVATGVGTAVAAVSASVPLVEAVVLTISGLGAGMLQTLGPALAADSVHPQERGDAIAVTGTFRAAALFGSPLGVGGLLGVLPLSAALGSFGALLAVPALTVARHRRARTAD